MKRVVSLIMAFSIVFGVISVSVDGAWADDRVERIKYYYENGLYCEAMDELSWLNASKDRSVWIQEDINQMEERLNYLISVVNDIYDKFGFIKNYLNKGLYYEAKYELERLKAEFVFAPMEEKRWGEYNLDAVNGISNYENKLKLQQAAAKTSYGYSGDLGYSNFYTVFTTVTGSKYHRSGCRYLRNSSYATTVNSARNRGYSVCKVCKPIIKYELLYIKFRLKQKAIW